MQDLLREKKIGTKIYIMNKKLYLVTANMECSQYVLYISL